MHAAHWMGNRSTKEAYSCGIEGGTKTSFTNTVNMKTPIALARKAQSSHKFHSALMMAE
jgi:hypothetical protein